MDGAAHIPPTISIEIDGAPMPRAWRDGLLRFDLSRALSCPARALLVIEAETANLRIGVALTVRLEELGETLFDGHIGAIETQRRGAEPQRLSIYAEDSIARLRSMPSGRVMTESTAVDVAGAAASELGLSLLFDGPRPEAVPVRILAGRSRFADLVAETRAAGFYFHLREGAFWLHRLAGPGRTRRIAPQETLDWRIERDETTPIEAVTVSGWSPSTGKGAQGMAFGHVAAEGGSGGECAMLNRVAASDSAALAEAEAEIERRDIARTVLSLTCPGSVRVALGDRLEAGALGAEDGPLPVTRIEERITSSEGHVVEISTRPPLPAPEPGGARLLWGRVIDTADPAKAGRVRCTLPACAGLETGWLSVLRPLAGARGGVAFVPGTGSDVAILGAERQLADGVVLGSLAGTRPLPLACGDNSRLALVSEGGQRVTLDDEAEALGFESAGGSRLTLSPEGGRLTAQGDLVLEAPGRSITIRAARIEFERG